MSKGPGKAEQILGLATLQLELELGDWLSAFSRYNCALVDGDFDLGRERWDLIVLVFSWAPMDASSAPIFSKRCLIALIDVLLALEVRDRLAEKGLPVSLQTGDLVENVPGAAGSIGVARVARAAPNGYTLDIVKADFLPRIGRVLNHLAGQPTKVRIEVGYDADLVLVNLHKTATIRNAQQETKSRWSPWDGVTLTGWPVRTWVLGQEVFHDGKINEAIRGREAQFDHARGGYWRTNDK